MKALYKSIFFCVTLALGMVSCDKDEIPPTGPLDNAEILVAGTYVGEWSRETDGTGVIETGPGSITFSVDAEKYSNNVSVMTLKSDEIDLGIDQNTTSVCNITILSSGEFTYWNNMATNPFGTTFYGNVSTNGVATIYFEKIIKDGRRETKYIFTFSGVKQ